MYKNVVFTKTNEEQKWQKALEQVFTPEVQGFQVERTVTTLSVRTMWDIYFQSRQFPKGSEIMMTAINISDMIKVVEEHGLVPIPVDIDPYTMAPTLASV